MSTARSGLVLALLIVGVVVTYAAPRLTLPSPRELPVKGFPERIGEWRMVAQNPVTKEIQERLTTATIVDRDYVHDRGERISFLLLTAREMRDIHSPSVCLPSSGWVTETDDTVTIGGVRMTARIMTTQGRKYHVWYWYPPTPVPEPANPLVRKLYRWRLRAPGVYRPDMLADLSSSLLVRVIAPVRPGSEDALRDFVGAVQAPLRDLTRSVEKDAK